MAQSRYQLPRPRSASCGQAELNNRPACSDRHSHLLYTPIAHRRAPLDQVPQLCSGGCLPERLLSMDSSNGTGW